MSKVRVILTFPPELIDLPLTYVLVKDFDLKINILRAHISPREVGKLVLEVENGCMEQIDQGLAHLQEKGIKVTRLSNEIKWNKDLCVHCGACTAVCLSKALHMEAPNWELEFDPDNCILCQLCVAACPLAILEASL